MFFVNNKPFLIYKTLMTFVGVWPMDKGKRLSTIVFSLMHLLQLWRLTLRLIDIADALRSYLSDNKLVRVMFSICTVSMHLNLRMKADRIASLMKSVTDDWFATTNPKEREIMRRYDRSGIYVWLMIAAYSTINPFVVIVWAYTLLDSLHPLIEQIREGPVFVPNNRWASTFDLLLRLSNILVGYTSYFITAMLIWSFAMHLSAQFKILKRQFQECILIESKIESLRVFRRLVGRHNRLLDLCQVLEDSFNTAVTTLIFQCQIFICMDVAHLVPDTLDALSINHIITVIGYFLIIFLICYAGDQLTTSCEEIGNVFTQCNWYDESKLWIINFSIVIARSRRPKSLTVLKFYSLNLCNFKRIIEGIYSYISLLSALKNKG